MKPLTKAIDDYLALRRSLGFKLHGAGMELAKFAAFMEQHNTGHVSTQLALEWAQLPINAQPTHWAQRLSYVRCFARHHAASDPSTEIPPPGLLPFRPARAHPYLYSLVEIEHLLERALQLSPNTELRRWTYHALLGLLSVTGLRVGEALRLKTADVDLDTGVLTVRGTKFGKSRLVPIHASTRDVLANYRAHRTNLLGERDATHFFVTRTGHSLDGGDVRRTFYRLSRQIGLRGINDSHGPRLHDFRHRFAVESLLGWYRSGQNVERRLPVLSTYLGHVHVSDTYWYLSAHEAGDDSHGATLGGTTMTTPSFSPLLQGFFTHRLMQQRQASPHTIGSYRDSFRLLLQFANKRLGVAPQKLTFEQVDAPLITAFLEDMQTSRGISNASRNLRLTAIRSFFWYASFEMPSHAAQIQRVLAIPNKRFTRTQIGFLTRDEVDALLRAPDVNSRFGRRDHALMLLAVQTGLRLSEITGLCRNSVCLDAGAHVRVLGKGRKERSTPLTKATTAVLRGWLREIEPGDDAIVFPSARGLRLSADGVQYLLTKHVAIASQTCGSLGSKRVTAHVLRHTTAMDLLQSGVERTVIALWLGHESIETTQIYLDANLEMKQAALDKVEPQPGRVGRFRADDQLLAFLKNL